MNSVETPDSSPTQTTDPAGAQRVSDDASVPYYFAVFYFQDGRRAELVIPGVTGMCGGGNNVDGPGRLSVYGVAVDGERRTRRLLAARLFNDLAELAVVAEQLELDIAETSEPGG